LIFPKEGQPDVMGTWGKIQKQASWLLELLPFSLAKMTSGGVFVHVPFLTWVSFNQRQLGISFCFKKKIAGCF